jgi:hypothetical protein
MLFLDGGMHGGAQTFFLSTGLSKSTLPVNSTAPLIIPSV